MHYATYPLLVALSLMVGWSIPGFYDWTGANQSRSSPLIAPIAIGLLIVGGLVCLLLPWLPLTETAPTVARVRVFRFHIRGLLWITAAVALSLALFRNNLGLVLGCCGYVVASLYALRLAILVPAWRWPLAGLLGCMYFPYAWILTYEEQAFGLWARLSMATGLPALVPTLLIGNFLQQSPQVFEGLPVLLSGAELWVGAWLIRLGPRRGLAYLVAVWLTSTFGSFALNALVRM